MSEICYEPSQIFQPSRARAAPSWLGPPIRLLRSCPVYEALSEEWGRRDGEISDLWADDGPSGYQPPSYEPVNPERRTPQTPSDGLI